MQNSVSLLQTLFLQQGFIHLAYKIITFIDLQTLYTIINIQQSSNNEFKTCETENISKSPQTQSKIKQMIQVHYFLKEYLNKTDRSMYYSFYDEPEFVCISKQLQENIVIRQCMGKTPKTNFSQQFSQFNQVLKHVQNTQLLPTQQLQQLKRILVDPSLPLPSIKRQNEGMYCNSSFQLFLIGLRFPHYGQQNFTPFEQFKQKIQDEEDINFKQFLQIQKQKHSSMKTYQNLHLVRYMPYQITYSNFFHLMLKDNSQHNLIVIMFALTDIWIESIFSIVNLIDDPFYKFIEIMSRYSAFRSFVIELQESLGFLFHSYENLYSDTIRDSLFLSSNMKPKYCFWRPALTKWFVKMNSIHTQTNQVYFMLLTKLREQSLLQNLDPQNDDPRWKLIKKHSICLKNSLQLYQLSAQMKEKIYSKMNGSSMIEQFISNNQQTCQALIFQYIEYIVDLAVNEQTVHWCGHSKHRLEKPFNIFSDQFKSYNASFVQNLKQNVLGSVAQKETKKNLLQILVQADVQFLENKNVKPVILRQFIQQINIQGKFFKDLIEKGKIQEKIMEIKQIEKNEELNHQSENIAQQLIFIDFVQKDQKLKYFNQKAKICQSIQGQQKCFFSIPPLLSPEQILTKSINTNDTSQNEDCDVNSSFEYVSDDECEELQIEKKSVEKTEQKTPLFNVHKPKQVKTKKVAFDKDYDNQIDTSECISSEKKTLHSTNSSVNDSHAINVNEQHEKSSIEQQQPSISKSQSI